MKLSLSWIRDHMLLGARTIDVATLAERLTARTAEIDGVERVSFNKDSWYAVKVVAISSERTRVYSSELGKELELSHRTDALVDDIFLAIKEGNTLRWAALADSGSSKEGLFPRVYIKPEELAGSWRAQCEEEDYILIIDNKALTNRPDLWGHRGFAREIAALEGVPLTNEAGLFKAVSLKESSTSVSEDPAGLLKVERVSSEPFEENPCKSLAAAKLSHVTHRPSSVRMAIRLARVDTKPHSALVDITNYVMWDIGQPMHAFDAQKVSGELIQGRFAHEGEQLALLDGTEITLHAIDYVIADKKVALSLAGVMGGASSMVQHSTHALIIEAGTFSPVMIRRTATAFKKRTESAVRFEKGLDPLQPVKALKRYLALLDTEQISYELESALVVSADPVLERVLSLSHREIEQKMGITLSSAEVKTVLESIGFVVELSQGTDPIYTVTVPSWRATKDVTIKEDIVEEVARLVGYDRIIPAFPYREMVAFPISSLERLRTIKKFLAFGLSMREIQAYSFFDESFLRTIAYEPIDTLRVVNPLSEHWQRLVTTLVPHLLESIYTNHLHHESLRFFELQRVWFVNEGPVEEQECAAIWYEKKKPLDFYEGKALLTRLFDLLHITIDWRKPASSLDPWYDSNQSAELWYKERCIGTAGKVDYAFLRTLVEGEAFIWELDANFLLHVVSEAQVYTHIAKYPVTEFDVSVLIGLEHTVASLEHLMKEADSHITAVALVDSFEKPEWRGKKSLTFRCTAYDTEKTLTKEVIDTIRTAVITRLERIGGEIR